MMRRPLASGMPREARLSRDHHIDLARFRVAEGQSPAPIVSRFAPEKYEPGFAYPLVIWLPTPDGDERQLRRIMPLLSLRNFVGASPRLPQGSDCRAGAGQCLDEAQEAVDYAIVSTADRFHIRQDAVFLMGHGESGTLAAELALLQPSRFAGVIAFNGPFPYGPHRLARLDEARDLRFLFCINSESTHYQPSDVCRDLRLFHAANLTIEIRQYPGDDDLTTAMLADANRWMMEVSSGSRLVG